MDIQLFSYSVLALSVVVIIALLYEAYNLWERGFKGMGVLNAVLAVICSAGISALYRDQIRALFGK